ncbi:Gfo/Idh/MocA family oxidoreductase [Cytophaga sp. FL35]|uniref:Gfo/Idh/MocA family protein n=1 Tax=Cytophaga sp. FL35 TaxID=1904456 RepID=UPI0016535CF1|nr:Gfo/Idh/MocA family oxidoreductase [Cytophaga sp. FL35]MBC6998796.1 Gfo/Idh/MocA family oxidoreductase [Cytophaga sp. FL35]
MKNLLLILLLGIQTFGYSQKVKNSQPVRVGVVGLVHGHVHWILNNEKKSNIEIVGIVEPNKELAKRLTKQYGLSMDIVFDSIEEMVKETQPEAVNAFNSTFDHLETVKFCAPRGIHVMVEKPLAVSWEHAQEMIALAKKHNIHLLTNYETTWYGSNQKAYDLIHNENAIGPMRKLTFHTGHFGPKEIGCDEEFLEWLTDPKLNGGGALMDFGCYGANISTWLMKGETPISVTCTVQQMKPEVYPKVEDDATIILTYPSTEVVIQASWNWPHHVKDMEIFGTNGYIKCLNGSDMMIMTNEKIGPSPVKASSREPGFDDPFALFKKVVHEGYEIEEYGLSSLENAEMVSKILNAAKKSSEQGKTIYWEELYP